jgi:hypothetical protein
VTLARDVDHTSATEIRMRLIAIIISATLLLLGCERYSLDRQMEKLCAQDGGVKVYETVVLPAAEYRELQKYAASATSAKTMERRYGPDYRYVFEYRILVGTADAPERGKGRLARFYSAIYRNADGRLLGESILYGRTGGDSFTFGLHPSSSLCPKQRTDLGQAIFVKGD